MDENCGDLLLTSTWLVANDWQWTNAILKIENSSRVFHGWTDGFREKGSVVMGLISHLQLTYLKGASTVSGKRSERSEAYEHCVCCNKSFFQANQRYPTDISS